MEKLTAHDKAMTQIALEWIDQDRDKWQELHDLAYADSEKPNSDPLVNFYANKLGDCDTAEERLRAILDAQ